MRKFSLLVMFPAETAILGRILAGFGEIEYATARCVGGILNDEAAATRALFRLTGGDVRLQVADAILRPSLESAGLKDEYEAALGALRCSKTIRNQYAHAHWLPTAGGLYFTDLSKAAKTATGELIFAMRHIDVPLLHQQENYMEYARDWMMFLHAEHERRAGRSASHNRKAPKIIDKPPLHNPVEEHPLLKGETGDVLPPEWPPPEDQAD